MQPTPVAILGTLAEFHREPIPYDLDALVRLVTTLRPELLCLDLTPDQWRGQDYSDLPPEYRDALLPLAHQTDIVVVPIAGDRPPAESALTGWRQRTVAVLRCGLVYLQRTAPGPGAINAGPRHFAADLIYETIALLAGSATRHAWRAHRDYLVEQVLAVVRRDPVARILVVVNVRHCHHLRRALRRYPEVQIVDYALL